MAKVLDLFETPNGIKVAKTDDGKYYVSNHSMCYYEAIPVETPQGQGYSVNSAPMVSGWMMKNLDDFKETIESMK